MAVLFCIYTSNEWEFLSSTSLLALGVANVLTFGHLNRCEEVYLLWRGICWSCESTFQSGCLFSYCCMSRVLDTFWTIGSCKYFLKVYTCLLILLTLSFTKQFLDHKSSFQFFFYGLCLGVTFKRASSFPWSSRFPPKLSFRRFTVLCSTFRSMICFEQIFMKIISFRFLFFRWLSSCSSTICLKNCL